MIGNRSPIMMTNETTRVWKLPGANFALFFVSSFSSRGLFFTYEHTGACFVVLLSFFFLRNMTEIIMLCLRKLTIYRAYYMYTLTNVFLNQMIPQTPYFSTQNFTICLYGNTTLAFRPSCKSEILKIENPLTNTTV